MIKIFGGYWIPKRKIEAIKKMYEQAYKIEKDSKLEKEGTYISWNWNHKYRVLYIDCPKCGNSIAIKRIEDETTI